MTSAHVVETSINVTKSSSQPFYHSSHTIDISGCKTFTINKNLIKNILLGLAEYEMIITSSALHALLVAYLINGQDFLRICWLNKPTRDVERTPEKLVNHKAQKSDLPAIRRLNHCYHL